MFEAMSIEVSASWWWFLGISSILGLVFLKFSYHQLRHWTWANYLGFISKFLALLILGFILLEPVSIKKEAIPGVNQLAVVIDNSQTMTVTDPASGESPQSKIQSWLDSEGNEWFARISNEFKTRIYAADSRLKPVNDPDNLAFSGTGSDLNKAINKLRDTYRNKPLAGIVLFSDGLPTDSGELLAGDKELPPIFVVPLGTEKEQKDIRLGTVRIRQSAFEDAPVETDIEASAVGLRGKKVQCTITRTDGKEVFSEVMDLPTAEENVIFRASWKPENKGLGFYKINLQLIKTAINPLDDLGEEMTELNNSQWIWVDHGQNAKRVLYVAGRPNWEFKFLNRAISEDPLIDLIGLIRIAKREPKFQFKGRSGETSNPLFRGFDKQDEETEKYDQPVLKRINVRDSRELSSGFPRNEEELFEYDAIILDDLESDFFSRNQLLLLREFVNRRGGGLMMLGGMESMSEGDYQSTPLKDVLPIYLENVGDKAIGDNIRMSLTDEGWLEPWARIRATESQESLRRQELKPYQAANVPGRQKPGASVISYMEDDYGNKLPAFVTQRYGKGKSAALMVTDFWRPGLQSPDAMKDVKKSWRQILRWLTSDVPQRMELALEPGMTGDHAVKASVKVLNDKFFEEENPSARLTVTPIHRSDELEKSGADNWQFELLPSIDRNAALETQFSARETGAYRVKAFVNDSDDIPVGSIETGWTSNPLLEEFRALNPNTAWMESITRESGGAIVPLDDIDSIETRLKQLDLPETVTRTVPLWHEPWLMGLAILLLLLEWGTRRYRGLA